MAHSAKETHDTFAQVVQSIPDYSEILILALALTLLWISSNEISDFMYLIRDAFLYRGGP